MNRRYRFDLARPLIMLVPEDFPALDIFSMLNTCLLARIHIAIGSSARFGAVDAGLATFKLRCFFVCELTGLDTLLNAILLVDIPLHIGLHPL